MYPFFIEKHIIKGKLNSERYIFGYMVRNIVTSRAVKRDFLQYIRRYTLLNMVIPILMHFCSFVSNWSVACHPTKCDVINDIKLFPDILSQAFDVIQSDAVLQKHVN